MFYLYLPPSRLCLLSDISAEFSAFCTYIIVQAYTVVFVLLLCG